jgi:hypothetical protein
MFKKLLTASLLLQASLLAIPVFAGDFDWINNLSIEAQANPDGFRARLATRFNVGDVKINAVVSNVGNQADAYMVLRLAEMSHQPVEYVERKYKSNRGRGWGRMAQDLGIKPGSREFRALKAGHDLDGDDYERHGPGKHKSHGKDKEKRHGRGHDDDRD